MHSFSALGQVLCIIYCRNVFYVHVHLARNSDGQLVTLFPSNIGASFTTVPNRSKATYNRKSWTGWYCVCIMLTKTESLIILLDCGYCQNFFFLDRSSYKPCGLMVTISRHSAFCHVVYLCVTHGSHIQFPHSIDRMVFVTETDFEVSSLLVR
jgi:hypothetical protein